jgi:hypothetical protein
METTKSHPNVANMHVIPPTNLDCGGKRSATPLSEGASTNPFIPSLKMKQNLRSNPESSVCSPALTDDHLRPTLRYLGCLLFKVATRENEEAGLYTSQTQN